MTLHFASMNYAIISIYQGEQLVKNMQEVLLLLQEVNVNNYFVFIFNPQENEP